MSGGGTDSEERLTARTFDVEEVVAQYRKSYQTYALLSEIVERLILEQASMRKLPIQIAAHRPKDPEHLREKITRTDKSYRDPLAEVTDLAGVRIVTEFLSDVDPILRMLREVFVVDAKRSVDYRIADDPRVFDYASAHYIVRLSGAASREERLKAYQGLWCEVQVRTMLQHVWATIAHERLYKPRVEPPKPLKRRFYALRGLLEIADREFDSIRKREEERRSYVEEQLQRSDFDAPIDFLSLPLFLMKKGITTRAGQPISGQTINDLVEEADAVGIGTLAELDRLLIQLETPRYRTLVEQVYAGQSRGGISLVRDAIRLANPRMYLEFALRNRPGFHPRLVREMCEGLQRLKEAGSSGVVSEADSNGRP